MFSLRVTPNTSAALADNGQFPALCNHQGYSAPHAGSSQGAVRLRLVSGSWKRKSTEAFLGLGILDNNQRLGDSHLWSATFIRKLQQRGSLLPQSLRIIRRVAQRIVAFRGGGETDLEVNQEKVDAFLWEISSLDPLCLRSMPWLSTTCSMPDPIAPIHDSDEDFKERCWRRRL